MSEGPEEPSTLTGSNLRLAVEMGGTAVWIPAGPTVLPQAVLNLTVRFSFRNKPRPSSSWIPPGGGSQTKGRMQVDALFYHLSAFPYSIVSLPCLRLGAQDNGLGCFC